MKAVLIALLACIAGSVSVQPASAAQAGKFREKVLYSFCPQDENCTDGAMPQAGLIAVNGALYGTTTWGGANCTNNIPSGCGALFSVNRDTGVEKALYSFCQQENCADGEYPSASLITLKGVLYGTTAGGGASNAGTIFSFDPGTGATRVLYSFCGQNCADGVYPQAGLVAEKGLLYGTTTGGGVAGCSRYFPGCGTVFSFDPKTDAEKVLYSFCSKHDRNGQQCTDGWWPSADLIEAKGKLYGTTSSGGADNGCDFGQCGTVFSVDPDTGVEKVLHSFAGGADGSEPLAGLIAVNGMLYGTTNRSGITACGGYGCGTLFSLDPGTGAETVLHTFCSVENCADGGQPMGGLIEEEGALYGTTEGGGAGGAGIGTVFSIDPNTGVEKVVFSFSGGDGADPQAGLVDVKGKLYGTTIEGGENGAMGTVFQLKK